MPGTESSAIVFTEKRLRHGHRVARLAVLVVAGLAVAMAAGFGWMASAWRTESERVAEAARLGSLERARALVAAGGADAREEALAALVEARPRNPEDVGLVRSALGLISVRESDFWPVARERRFGAVSASPDATSVIFSPETGVVEVWRVRTRERLARVSSGEEEFHYPVLRNDSRYLGARREGGGLVVWDLEDGKEVCSLSARRVGSSRQAIAFAPPEEEVVFYSDQAEQRIKRVSLPDGKVEHQWLIETAIGPIACYHSDKVAVGCDDGVRLLLPGGGSSLVLPTPAVVTCLAWRPDGQLLVGGLADGRLIFRHFPSGRTWVYRGHDSLVNELRFSDDGRLLASAGWDGRTIWFDGAGHGPLLTQKTGVIMALGSGKALFYRGEAGVGEWTVTSPEGYRRFQFPEAGGGEVSGIAIDSTAGLLAASNRETVRFWDLNSGDLVAESSWPQVRGLALRGKDFLAAGRDGVAIFEPEKSGRESWRVRQAGTMEGTQGRAFSDVAVAGESVVALGASGMVRLTKNRVEEIRGMSSGSEARLAVAHDGSVVASSLWKGGGTFISGDDGETRIGHAGGAIALSSDGARAVAGANDGYGFWINGKAGWAPVAVFPDDQGGDFPGKAVFAGKTPMVAWLWRQSGIGLLDESCGTLVERERFFPRGDSSLFALALSADDRWLAAGSGDGVVHLWDLTTSLPGSGWSIPPSGEMPQRLSMALMTALVVLLLAGTAAGWLVSRERRLLGGFIESQSELQEQRERLRLAERMETLGRLSAGVAHDFRNLLSVIRVRSGLLRRAVCHDADLAGDADAIEGAVLKAEGVVRALLQLGQSGGGREGSFDAGEELLGLKDLFHAKARGVEDFEIRIESHLPLAAGRAVEFQQIALNLGWNAIDIVAAMGGKVLLSLQSFLPVGQVRTILDPEGSPAIWLIVEDGGPGVGEDEIERIFEPFYSTKGMGPERGTGLGLSTVHAICRTLGYQLSLGRSPDLHGALFAVGLPACLLKS